VLNRGGCKLVAPGRGENTRQAIATRTVASGAASAWQCERSHQAVVVDFTSFEALGGTCPPPGGLEAGSAWRHVSPARRIVLLQL